MSTRFRLGMIGLAAAITVTAVGVAPKPAAARVHVFVGGFFGGPAFAYPAPYYYPPAFYYPPAYYYPPTYYYPPAYYQPANPGPAYPPPPASTAAPAAAAPAASTPTSLNCRQFQTTVQVDGVTQPSTGTACQQPDGTWKLVN